MEAVESMPISVGHSDFDSFYRACWIEVYTPLAVTLSDSELAREAVDEAMVRALRRWQTVRQYRNQTGWVYRVALNWAVSQLRKTRREVHGERPSERTQPDASPPVDLYDALRRHRRTPGRSPIVVTPDRR